MRLEQFSQQIVNGISLGSIYALVALGYTMVYGIIKLINFAHGDIYMVGAYVGFAVTTFAGIDSFLPNNIYGSLCNTWNDNKKLHTNLFEILPVLPY